MSEYHGAAQAKYDIRHTLGTGNFSVVKMATNRETGRQYAIKIIEKQKFLNQPKVSRAFEREVEILKSCNHPQIIRFIDVIDDGGALFIVMDLVTGGDLLRYINNRGMLEELEACEITRQICEAVRYLHQRNVTHRDLKPDNILMTVNNEIKVSDFGLAKAQSPLSCLRTVCGTPTYLAPEIVSGGEEKEGYSTAVDCWSLGVIVYYMLVGKTPFNESKVGAFFTGAATIRSVDYSVFAEKNISEEARKFVDRLLQLDPKNRMTAEEALVHPWIVNSQKIPRTQSTRDTSSPELMDKRLLESAVISSRPTLARQITVPVNDALPETSVRTWGVTTARQSRSSVDESNDPMILSLEKTQATDTPDGRQPVSSGLPIVLEHINGCFKGRDAVIYDGIMIGRSVGCDLRLEDKRISSIHAKLWKDDEGYVWIRDTSHNGIYLNDKRIEKEIPVMLCDGDELSFIQSELDDRDYIKYKVHTEEKFVTEYAKNAPKPPGAGQKHKADDEEEEESGSERPRTRRKTEDVKTPPTPGTPNPKDAWARLLSINSAYEHAVLNDVSTILGRQTDCPEKLRYLDARISAHHCTIFRRGRVPYIQDTSANGTYVNGHRLVRGMMHELHEMDEIVLMHDEKNRELERAKVTDKCGRPVLIGYFFQLLG